LLLLLLGILCLPFLPRMITAERNRDAMVICSPIVPQKLAVIEPLVTMFASERISGARDLRYPHPQPLIRVLRVNQESSNKVILPLRRHVRVTTADNRRTPFLASAVFVEMGVVGRRRRRRNPIQQDEVPL